MADINICEQDIEEPALMYWKPTPKMASVAPPMQTFTRNPPIHYTHNYPQQFVPLQFNQQVPIPMEPTHQTLNYPKTSYLGYPVHSYDQNQQVALAAKGVGYESDRRRVLPCPQINAESLLSAMSATPNLDQNSQIMTDNLIHEEVTRAAKTLFSKRNRTLLHWLNPDISKNQLKIDVNAAWESLPTPEKVFYISQVLGKFAPHTTSLMVNPQLEPSKAESGSVSVKTEKLDPDDRTSTSNDSGCSENFRISRKTSDIKVKKPRNKNTYGRNPQKRKSEYISDDDGASCDSGLVMDVENIDQPESDSRTVLPTVKRKYTKRKPKDKAEVSIGEMESNSCPLPVNINDIKIEKNNESTSTCVPKVKRKYIKRKLVRKKYKKREPKNKLTKETISQSVGEESMPEPTKNDDCEDMDIWIELENDTALSKGIEEFKLLSEEVDNFWESIEDPNSLFLELEIE